MEPSWTVAMSRQLSRYLFIPRAIGGLQGLRSFLVSSVLGSWRFPFSDSHPLTTLTSLPPPLHSSLCPLLPAWRVLLEGRVEFSSSSVERYLLLPLSAAALRQHQWKRRRARGRLERGWSPKTYLGPTRPMTSELCSRSTALSSTLRFWFSFSMPMENIESLSASPFASYHFKF